MVRADHQIETNKTMQLFKGKHKKFYAYIRHIQTVKDRIMQLKKMDGMLTEDNVETAELLCSTFKEVFTVEDAGETDGNTVVVEGGDDVKQAEDILVNMVFDKLSKLECIESPGSDGIRPYLLKLCALSLAGPLAVIFQKSFDIGELPKW
jgi:hypothetical protein